MRGKMVKKTKIPMRTCIGCNAKKPKKEMIRMVTTTSGDYEIDTTGKKSGRGFYLCWQMECLNKAVREKKFNKLMPKDNAMIIFAQLKEKITKENK